MFVFILGMHIREYYYRMCYVHIMQASVIIQRYLLTVMSELWDIYNDQPLEDDHIIILFTCRSGLIRTQWLKLINTGVCLISIQ